MNIKLVVDDLEIQVGYELLETIADRIGDSSDFEAIYHKLAQSKNPDVRYAIAYYDNISSETAELLLEDNEIRILERILDGSERIAKVSEESIRRVIEKYPITDILKAVASNFEDIDSEDTDAILDLVMEKAKDNYPVLGSIADGYNSPKSILKKLAKHSDPDISRKAKESLK